MFFLKGTNMTRKYLRGKGDAPRRWKRKHKATDCKFREGVIRVQKKRVLLLLCLVVVLGFTLPATAKEIVLQYWRHSHEAANELDALAIAEFEKKHPNVKVEMTIIPGDRDLEMKLLTALVGGVGPDVANISSFLSIIHMTRGTIQPVVPRSFGVGTIEEFEELWLPGSFDAWTLDGKIYGVPSELSQYGFWINRDHFEEAGLDPDIDFPKTWEQVAEVGQKLTQTQMGRISRQGYVQYILTPSGLETMVNQLGGSFLNEEGTESRLNSPEVIKALQTKQDLVYKTRISDPTHQVDPSELFATGQASMSDYGGSWYLNTLDRDYPEINYKPLPFPRFEDGQVDTGSILYGYAQVVNAKTEYPELAWELVSTLASYPEKYIQVGLFQPRKGWFESEEARNYPYFDLWLDEVSKGNYHFRSTSYMEVHQVLVDLLQSVMMDQADVEKAVEEAHQKINDILLRSTE